MKYFSAQLSVSLCCVLLALVSIAPLGFGQTTAEENVALRWDQVALQAVRNTRLGPPMTARGSACAARGSRPAPSAGPRRRAASAARAAST